MLVHARQGPIVTGDQQIHGLLEALVDVDGHTEAILALEADAGPLAQWADS